MIEVAMRMLMYLLLRVLLREASMGRGLRERELG
jgi:hypothetical protein